MVSKESSHLLTSQTNGKSTLADKHPGTMTVRSVLLNRDSPDIESRLKKRRNRTHQVRFKDLEDGSSSSGNSGTGDNSSHQKTSKDCVIPHALRKHASRTPLPWADETHISSLPGQTSVVGAVRGDMASTIEIVAAFLARAPPHPLTPGPTRRSWTPPQANSLTLPMARKPSTSTAIQTSPCLKKPLATHTRSHSLGDSVAIDGDDEHDSQDENLIHNHRLAHRSKDSNGPSGSSERTNMERKSKSRTEIKSAVTVVKNSRIQNCPSVVSHIEPCHCCSVVSRESTKRQGSSTPSLVRRRKRFSRTTSDPGREVHYCTTPTQTESHSLSPPRASTKLYASQVQTESSSSCSNPKYSTTPTEHHIQSLPVNDPTLSSHTNMDANQTPTKSASYNIPTAPLIEPCNMPSQMISPCASQVLTSPVNTMQIRSENFDSSLGKNQDPLPNQTVPYNFVHVTPYLPKHANKSFSSVEKCATSTQMLQSNPCSDTSKVSAPHSVTPVVTPLAETTNATLCSVSPIVTLSSVDPVITSQSLSSVFTPHCDVPPTSQCLIISDVKHSVSTLVTEHDITPVTLQAVAPVVNTPSVAEARPVAFHTKTPNAIPSSVLQPVDTVTTAPQPVDIVTAHSFASDATSLSTVLLVTSPSVPPVVTAYSGGSNVTPNSGAHVVTLRSESPPVTPNFVAPNDTPDSGAHVVTPLSVDPTTTPHSIPPNATNHFAAHVATPLSVSPLFTPNFVASNATPQSSAHVVFPVSVPSVVTPQSVDPVITLHPVAPVVTPSSVEPLVSLHTEVPVVTPNPVSPVVTSHSGAHVVTPLSDCPVVAPSSSVSNVTPHPGAHVAIPLSDSPAVTPNSITPNATLHSGAPVVCPISADPLVTLQPKSPVVIPNSIARLVSLHTEAPVVSNSVAPLISPHSNAHVATPNCVEPLVSLHTDDPVVIPNPVPPVVAPHTNVPNVTPHSGAHVSTPLFAPPVIPKSIAPNVTPHPMLNYSIVPQSSTPGNAVILPVYSCSTSLSVIQDCTSPISNIYPSSSLTCSAPVPKITSVVPSNITNITRRVPTPVNVIPLLPNATCPTNVAPCTFVTQTAISCTSISYYTTTHPVGPTGPQSHILPPAYATLVQTVSHCNIPCQVLQNAINTKITPFSSPVPKLKSCTSQPILVKTYTSNLPIVQQCVTPTKKAPLYSSTFRAAPPYTPPSQTQDKRGVRLPPPPPPPPPYTPRKNTNDKPATQTSLLRTDNVTEKDKDGSMDKKDSIKSKDSPKLGGRASSLKHRALTPPVAFMKERGSPAKACLKSTCLSSAQAQLGVLHKMLCSGARPRPNTPCQFPLPQTQQGRSRIRRCSVPSDCPTSGPLTPAQADTLRQVQEILGGLMSGAKCKLDPSKVTEKLLSPNGPLRDIRSLQTQLQSLEGVLETSQNTIKVLLDVIQDLEKKEAVRDGRHLYRTGQDIENCGTCRDCACIIYSVEHDFRLQEGQVVRTWKVGDPPEARPQTPTPPPSTPDQQDSPQAERPPVSAKKNRKKCFWFL